MGDVPVNFTLSGDAQGAVQAARQADAAMAQAARSARDVGREAAQAEAAMAKLARGMDFHGSRSRTQIAAQLAERVPDALGSRYFAADRGRATMRAGGNGLAREIERQRAELRQNADAQARLDDENARFAERLARATPARQKAVRRIQNKFIADNELGDVADAETQNLSRGLRRVRRSILNAVQQGLRETGGDAELLREAGRAGVDLARPLAVRQFAAEKAAAMANATATERAMRSPALMQRARFEGIAINSPEDALAFRSMVADERRATVREPRLAAAAEAGRAKLNAAYEQQIRDNFAKQADEVRRAAKRPDVLAAARFEGVAETPEAIREFRAGTLYRRALSERSRRSVERSLAAGRDYDAEGVDHDSALPSSILPRPREVAHAVPGIPARRITADERDALRGIDESGAFRRDQIERDAADRANAIQQAALAGRADREDRALTRSNRLARRDDLLAQRRGAFIRSSFNVAGVALAGVHTAANLLAAQRAADAQLADSAAAYEMGSRPLVGLGDNVNRIGAVRRSIDANAIATGSSVADSAAFLTRLQSDAGDFAPDVQRGLRFASQGMSKLSDSQPEEVLAALIKTLKIMPDAGSPEAVTAKMMKATDVSSVTMKQLSEFFPMIMPVAKMQGYKYDESLATTAVAANVSGRFPDSANDIKLLMLGMGRAYDAGLATPGKSFVENYQEVIDHNPKTEQLRSIFGVDSLDTFSALKDLIAEIKQNTAAIAQARENTLVDKLTKLANDPITSNAQRTRALDSAAEIQKATSGRGNDAKALEVGYTELDRTITGSIFRALANSPAIAPVTRAIHGEELTQWGYSYAASKQADAARESQNPQEWDNFMKSRVAAGELDIADSTTRKGERKTNADDIDAWQRSRKEHNWEDMPWGVHAQATALREYGTGDPEAYIAAARKRFDERAKAREDAKAAAAKKAAAANKGPGGLPATAFTMLPLLPDALRGKEFFADLAAGKSPFEAKDAANARLVDRAQAILRNKIDAARAARNPFAAAAAGRTLAAFVADRSQLAGDADGETALDRQELIDKLREEHPDLAAEIDAAMLHGMRPDGPGATVRPSGGIESPGASPSDGTPGARGGGPTVRPTSTTPAKRPPARVVWREGFSRLGERWKAMQSAHDAGGLKKVGEARAEIYGLEQRLKSAHHGRLTDEDFAQLAAATTKAEAKFGPLPGTDAADAPGKAMTVLDRRRARAQADYDRLTAAHDQSGSDAAGRELRRIDDVKLQLRATDENAVGAGGGDKGDRAADVQLQAAQTMAAAVGQLATVLRIPGGAAGDTHADGTPGFGGPLGSLAAGVRTYNGRLPTGPPKSPAPPTNP